MSAINLVKGQKVELNKEVNMFKVGLGWDTNAANGAAFDLDAMAMVINEDGIAVADDFIYFGHLINLTESVKHSGDNLTGEGSGDDEVITIDVNKLPKGTKEVKIFVTIYDAVNRGQNFGQVKNAKANLYEGKNTTPAITFDLEEDASMGTLLDFCRIYNHNGVWKFEATGATHNKATAEFIAQYGL